jgi:glutamate synthase (ferredoxin)
MLTFDLRGSAGQSFGAFLVGGMDVTVTGEANDYIGKSMAGGTLTIKPPPGAAFEPSEASIVGNTCLYGATGGKFFVHGRAGERFAVRNSMADTVCEGAGDHCCEYMTGGTVVMLGPVGRNVAAGMTGGLAYFYDSDGSFCSKVNAEIVSVQRIVSDEGEQQLKSLIQVCARYPARTPPVSTRHEDSACGPCRRLPQPCGHPCSGVITTVQLLSRRFL